MNLEEFKIINETQNEYENLLINKIVDDKLLLKVINFSSPTGTGKTKMMADVIEKMSNEYFFVVTTLSRGQLNNQIRNEINKYTKKSNWLVYGLNDFTKNTILQADDILAKIPNNKKLVWFRDEGHINTNRWMGILENISYKIINMSATNKNNSNDDIFCNFNHTMMLRTVVQCEGEPKDALDKLLQVKEQHNMVKNYNPCAIFRVLDENILNITIKECKKRNLKYINITDENYDMSEICKDNNEYDVIINKFKIVEGIDIRRAHVLYMTNEPKNPSTTIQIIGRCRRNALLYRDDIDILSKNYDELLKNTRICYCFYNVKGMNIETDDDGNLISSFCNIISVQDLKIGAHIKLENGYLKNGLKVYEANNATGEFDVLEDINTGFNILSPLTDIYKQHKYKYVLCKYKNFQYLFDCSDIKKLNTRNGYYDLFERKKTVYSLSKIRFKEFLNFLKNKNMTTYEIRYSPENKFPYILDIQTLSIDLNYDAYEYVDINALNNDDLFNMLKKETSRYTKRFLTENEMNNYINSEEMCKPIDTDDLFFDDKSSDSNTITFTYMNEYVLKPILEIYDNYDEQLKKYTKNQILNSYGIVNATSMNIINDFEISVIGIDSFKIYKENGDFVWNEDKMVTSKIRKNTKLNKFISKKYSKIINDSSKYTFSQNSHIFNTNKLNSMFGYCVEFYCKFLLDFEFDNNYRKLIMIRFWDFLKRTHKKFLMKYSNKKEMVEALLIGKETKLNDYFNAFVIRTEVIIEYQKQMNQFFSLPATKIPSMTYFKLLEEKEFVNRVVEYGKKTFNFLLLYFNLTKCNYKEYYFDQMKNCFLGTKHLIGVADFIIGDTIIDLKCTSSINEAYIKQILAYYWLAQKLELNINKVMIYEAIKNKYILIDINSDSIESNVLDE